MYCSDYFTCGSILVVEGGARGGIKIDILESGGGVPTHQRVACYVGYAFNKVCRGFPADSDGRSDAAPLVLEVWVSRYLFFHLDKEIVQCEYLNPARQRPTQ